MVDNSKEFTAEDARADGVIEYVETCRRSGTLPVPFAERIDELPDDDTTSPITLPECLQWTNGDLKPLYSQIAEYVFNLEQKLEYILWHMGETGETLLRRLQQRSNARTTREAVAEFVTYNEPELARRLSLCLLYTSPSPRDRQKSRMPSSA